MNRKKILFFVTEFPTLSETFILNQITGAVDMGHKVEIIALKKGNVEKLHPKVEEYQLMEKVTFIDIPDSKIKRLISCIIHPFATFRTFKMRYGKVINTLTPSICAQKLSVRGPSDLIIAHYGNVGLIASILKDSGYLKGELITFFHGYDLTRTLKQKGSNYYSFLFESDVKLLPISKFWAERLIALGTPVDKIKIHHMGIELTDFPFQPRELNQNGLRLLIVARLTEKKGIEDAIKALSYLENRYKGLELHIIGDGSEKSKLQQLASHLKIEDKVLFHGFMDQLQVKEQFKKSDIFLLPSVEASDGDMEGIPVSLMEAMAQGKPVISTFHSGIPEIISHKETGLLVKEHDPEELAEAIIYYMGLNEATRQSMLIHARKKS
ncbi:glycosyltransferase [Listeria fleischmannii]|uniref:glycosyltransferase n=1 Tax=Listeria fleischmannii TaxID=1069827 RepID=UPI0002BC7A5F|nr:glycosyltransferase [Listeria fleischmannii]EMG26701.1 colanic acid biosynthesis glycosyltransferase WcaL [Listeria fleischmannii subsp. fleischmannii LU2006-1]